MKLYLKFIVIFPETLDDFTFLMRKKEIPDNYVITLFFINS